MYVRSHLCPRFHSLSALKQIDIRIRYWDLYFDIEQEFTKNPMVEEITFKLGCVMNVPDLKKMFDALPNIKRVRVVSSNKNDIENLPVFLKMIGDFKKLESLHFAKYGLKKFYPKISMLVQN